MKLSHGKLTELLTQIPSTFDIEFTPVHSDVMELTPSKREIKVILNEELMLATITIIAIPDLELNYVAVYHSMDKWANNSNEFHELMEDLIQPKEDYGVDTEEAIRQLVYYIESIIEDEDLYYEILYSVKDNNNEKCSTEGFAQWLLINY